MKQLFSLLLLGVLTLTAGAQPATEAPIKNPMLWVKKFNVIKLSIYMTGFICFDF